jgi:DNA polymerase-3 subunit gamma/tau
MAKRPTKSDSALSPGEGAGHAEAPAERDPNTSDMFGAPAAPADATMGQRPYVVLARKYRPRRFEDLIGQEAMVTTLRNAFASHRIAQAYMLTGVRGVGKTTTARILARALNYARPGHKDGPTIDMPEMGEHCAAIMESRHPDILEMDAASNTGVDNVREIIEGARYRPISARYRVYIIDEVHMLSKGAFNALLKTLEEPPEHVKFIFATTEIRKVPVTVLSRCQRFDLRRVGADLLAPHFARIAKAEGVMADADALALIARAAEGSVRDGLSLLDQAIAMGAGSVTAPAVRAMLGLADRSRVFELTETVLGGDAAGALAKLSALHKDGAEPLTLMADLAETVHLASRAKVAGAASLDETLSEEERRRAVALAERLSVPVLARAWQMLLKGLDEAGRAPDPAVAAEMVLIRMAFVADLPTPDEVLRGGTVGAGRPTSRQQTGREGAASGAPVASHAPATAAPRGQVPPWVDQGSPTGKGSVRAEAGGGGAARAALVPAPVRDVDGEPPLALATFEDVVALAGERRDLKLKVALEDQVSLVRYEPGKIELYLLDGAPRELANDLREKLNQWTGRKWMVALARERGAPSIGSVRRERQSAELDEALRDPLAVALFKHFPDAEVIGLKAIFAPGVAEATDSGETVPDEDESSEED